MSVKNMWNDLHSYLDDDERLVWPDMYLKNRHLYDDVRGVVYLIRDRKFPDSGLEWVSEWGLGRALKNDDIDLLAKQLVVRLRLPWNKVQQEWLISQEELNEDREYYEVLDTFLRVRHKDSTKEIPLFDTLDFETHRDDYEVMEVRYLVGRRYNKATQARLLGIDPDSITTYMQQ